MLEIDFLLFMKADFGALLDPKICLSLFLFVNLVPLQGYRQIFMICVVTLENILSCMQH